MDLSGQVLSISFASSLTKSNVEEAELEQQSSSSDRIQVITGYSEDISPTISKEKCPQTNPPPPEDISWDAQLWQEVRDENVFLLNAYYDDRYKFKGRDIHFVRIIAAVRDALENPLHCYLWPQDDEDKEDVNAKSTFNLVNSGGQFTEVQDDTTSDEKRTRRSTRETSDPKEEATNYSLFNDLDRVDGGVSQQLRSTAEKTVALGTKFTETPKQKYTKPKGKKKKKRLLRKVASVVKAQTTELWVNFWPKGSSVTLYKSFLISCPIPAELVYKVSAVSLSPKKCDTRLRTYLNVTRSSTEKTINKKKQSATSSKNSLSFLSPASPSSHNFVVCVKALDFLSDISERLVEWLELQRVLGATKIVFYLFEIHNTTKKVLDYYQKEGFVDVRPFSLPGQLPNEPEERRQFLQDNLWQKRRMELIPYNDCLYSSLKEYNYAVLLDIDEALIPIQHDNWSQLLDAIFKSDPAAMENYPSFSAQNAYFFDRFPSKSIEISPKDNLNTSPRSQFHMLNHLTRAKNFSRPGYAVKSFISTQRTLAVFNHYALFPLKATMRRNALISRSLAQLNHYRKNCPRSMRDDCRQNFLMETVNDDVILKFKGQLVSRVKEAWQDISATSL